MEPHSRGRRSSRVLLFFSAASIILVLPAVRFYCEASLIRLAWCSDASGAASFIRGSLWTSRSSKYLRKHCLEVRFRRLPHDSLSCCRAASPRNAKKQKKKAYSASPVLPTVQTQINELKEQQAIQKGKLKQLKKEMNEQAVERQRLSQKPVVANERGGLLQAAGLSGVVAGVTGALALIAGGFWFGAVLYAAASLLLGQLAGTPDIANRLRGVVRGVASALGGGQQLGELGADLRDVVGDLVKDAAKSNETKNKTVPDTIQFDATEEEQDPLQAKAELYIKKLDGLNARLEMLKANSDKAMAAADAQEELREDFSDPGQSAQVPRRKSMNSFWEKKSGRRRRR